MRWTNYSRLYSNTSVNKHSKSRPRVYEYSSSDIFGPSNSILPNSLSIFPHLSCYMLSFMLSYCINNTISDHVPLLPSILLSFICLYVLPFYQYFETSFPNFSESSLTVVWRVPRNPYRAISHRLKTVVSLQKPDSWQYHILTYASPYVHWGNWRVRARVASM